MVICGIEGLALGKWMRTVHGLHKDSKKTEREKEVSSLC